MNSKKILLRLVAAAIIVAGIVLAGCKGEQGAQGPAGRNPEGPPIITAIMASPDSIAGGSTAQLLVAAYDPNGDSISYSWSASSGVFTNPYSAATVWTAPQETGIVMVHVTVTANGQTAVDSARVGVNMRVPSSEVAYLGGNGAACSQCHASITDGFHTTDHSAAYTALVAAGSAGNNYCLECHTTGFDDTYNHSGDSLLTHGHDMTGYDNLRTANLEGVQCESCHGQMGPAPLNHSPQPLANIVNGNKCDQCHDQNAELAQSGHGTVIAREGGQAAFLAEWGNTGCQDCHVSEGFIQKYDGNFASTGMPLANQISCPTCHDPHNKTNEFQLRTVADVTSPYSGETSGSYTISGLGTSQLCATCHHGRRSNSQITAQINNGSAHPGPHESPQADMVSGHGDYEVAGTVNRTNQHSGSWDDPRLGGVCVGCHMLSVPRAAGVTPEFGHKFEPDVRVCQKCHATATDFDVAGVQTHTTMLMDSLASLLPHDSTGAVMSAMDTVNWTRPQREAGYTYFFVKADGSKGVHNASYATSILNNAIAHLASAPNN